MEEKEVDTILMESNGEPATSDLPVVSETLEPQESSSPPDEMPDPPEAGIVSNNPLPTNETIGVTERLVAIEEELKRSNLLFESKFVNDATKEEMINRLHKELQEYKDDLHKKILKPIIMDMIVFADNMKALVSRFEETPEEELMLEKYQKLRNEFLKIGSHIDDVVYNYGVEPFSSVPGDEFNPKTQHARKTTVTGNPDDHKKIISSLIAGYTWDEQLLRRESVHINTCEPVKNDTNNQ